MFTITLDGSQVSIIAALLAGFITFFASCLLPLVPTYLAFLSGMSLSQKHTSRERLDILKISVLFVLGFVAVFVALGAVAYQVNSVFTQYRPLIEKIAGFFFIVLGLSMAGVIKNKYLVQEKKFELGEGLRKFKHLYAVLAGVVFGFGWTPCIGPVLAVILFWASQADTQLQGLLLLTSYGIGLGIPFIAIGVGYEYLIPRLEKSRNITHAIGVTSAVIVLISGILLLTGTYQHVSMWLLAQVNAPVFTK